MRQSELEAFKTIWEEGLRGLLITRYSLKAEYYQAYFYHAFADGHDLYFAVTKKLSSFEIIQDRGKNIVGGGHV